MKDSKYYETVKSEVDDIIKTNSFGTEFEFKPGQRAVVEELCVRFLEWSNGESEIDSAVVYAPTGYGKSILAMFASRVLQRLSYSGYVLTVDLLLQQQYENDFKNFRLNFHSIKGTENYKCHENGQTFKNGECHSMNLSYKQLTTLKCYQKCAYLQARNRAIRAPVSLLNYQYWLMQRNHVARKVGDPNKVPFQERDFIFFDECHKLDDIVQNSFSIKINNDFSDQIVSLNHLLLDNGYLLEDRIDSEKIDSILEVFQNSSNKILIKEKLIELKNLLYNYTSKEEDMKKFMSQDIEEGDYVPDEWKRIFNIINELDDIQSRLEDYVEIADEVGYKNIIIRNDEEFVEFVSLMDDFLIKKYVLKRSGFKIFLSATLGDVTKYAKVIGLSQMRVLNLANRFNYDRSPIYFTRDLRLDYENKKHNLQKAIDLVDHIIATKHLNSNGIIHTGSYEFTKALLLRSKFRRRFIDYDSSNKRSRLKKFLNPKTSNKILIGPSLLEGLDLYDGLCRFQIFFKVPFPSLKDPLVNEKLKYFPLWYSWKTSISVIQGSNRGVRHTNDWCDTFFIDSCIIDLLKRKLFDVGFMKRFKEYIPEKEGFKTK
jgi:ATP-dependent DNA helicase DinG